MQMFGRRASLLGGSGWLFLTAGHASAQPQQSGASGPPPDQDQSDAMSGLVTEDLLHDATSPVLGNPAGDVTMVEFFDYRCPYCKVMAPRLASLIEKDSGLRLVMKEYPILSRESIFAAKVALVAARHGAYAAFYAAMFNVVGRFDDQKTLQVAQSVGLSPAVVSTEMKDEYIVSELHRNIALGEVTGVRGTPAFVVDHGIVPGAVSIEVLSKMIDAARKKRG